MAPLTADNKNINEKTWLQLRVKGRFIGDPFAPAVDAKGLQVLKDKDT